MRTEGMMPNQNETFELKKSYTLKFFEEQILIQFDPIFHFCTPWKRQKTKGFLTFSGGIEMEHLG